MTKIARFIALLVMFFVLSNCKSDTTNTSGLVALDLAEAVKNQETGYASDLFDEVSITVLDGQGKWFFPGHMITNVYHEDYSLFYDLYENAPIGIFDKEGKLFLSLDKHGKGPGEYTVVADVGMNPEQTKICVNEGHKKKMHWYDLKGNWIESIDLPTKFNNLHVLPGGKMILQNKRYDTDEYDSIRLMLTDSEGKFLKSIWNKPMEVNDYPQFMDGFWIRNTGKNGLFYRDSPLYDTIYSISDDTQFEARYIFDVGNLGLPIKIAEDFNRSQEWINYLRVHRYFTTGDNLVISGAYKKWVHFIANLKDGTIKCYNEIKDDLIGYRSIPYDQTQDGKYLVQQIHVQYAKDNLETMFPKQDVQFPEKRDKLKELITSADENTDVILVYYRIKN
ncbi:MAG: 6-bladed beta-propeller [Bacteroidales bacterium]|nr:6-bladed beta-propeller [Bacteroidales bacterium]